ncbi:phage tail assembly protein [Streptomyces sp. NPDC001339]|uniref:phage tail assembly protein n=1 Tax=Streptomyces sp. NPDC001339 TaxID=3364563 RepID=UPI0036AE182D
MARVTLDEIRRAAERQYGDFDIALPDGTTATLRSPLRMSAEERSLLGDVESLVVAGDTGAITEALKIAAKTPEQAARLLDALGGDLATAAVLFEQWATAVSVGEPSPSAS